MKSDWNNSANSKWLPSQKKHLVMLANSLFARCVAFRFNC